MVLSVQTQPQTDTSSPFLICAQPYLTRTFACYRMNSLRRFSRSAQNRHLRPFSSIRSIPLPLPLPRPRSIWRLLVIRLVHFDKSPSSQALCRPSGRGTRHLWLSWWCPGLVVRPKSTFALLLFYPPTPLFFFPVPSSTGSAFPEGLVFFKLLKIFAFYSNKWSSSQGLRVATRSLVLELVVSWASVLGFPLAVQSSAQNRHSLPISSFRQTPSSLSRLRLRPIALRALVVCRDSPPTV
ncbi:uncharacterized protein BKA78DRAFT_138725 [Phyllosticta capitalensis]|uniref:uncharacterized protein n=1 Tax=Phyllosticta capitalensis TaxID=121624 RepID=UPI00312ED89A